MEDKRITTMAKTNPVLAVLKMGLPVTCGMLVMVAYNLVDTYFVGLMHDDAQLAATSLAYPVLMICIALSGIVGNGGASYIARCLGAGERDRANQTLSVGFYVLLLMGILVTLLGIVFIDPLVTLLGAKADIFSYTKDYTIVLVLGSIFTMGNYAVGQLLRSEGSTFYSMVGMMAGTITNIILDPIFIFTLKLEVKGAAIATILGNIVSVGIFAYYYLKKKTLLQPVVSYFRWDKDIIKEIMLVGIPHTLEQFFATAAVVVNNNLAAEYGKITVAAMGVANKLITFGSYVYQGMTAGCQPLIGFNYGAKDYKRLKQVIRAGIGVTTAMELVIMGIFAIFAPKLVGLFSESPEVIAVGAKTLRAMILMLPFVSTVAIARNTFNSIGKPFYSFFITAVRQLVFYIPLLILLNNLFGYDGLIHAQPVEEVFSLLLSVYLLVHFLKKDSLKHKIVQ